MAQVEIRKIIETWKSCGESYSEAARRLGVDRRTVKRWVGTREAALGVCALASGEEKIDGGEATQAGVDRRVGRPGEDLAGSHGLVPGEACGVGPGTRFEGLPINDTPVSEEVRVGAAQHQTAKASVPERPGNETP